VTVKYLTSKLTGPSLYYTDSETHYVPKQGYAGSVLRLDLIHLSMNAIKQVWQ